MQIETLTWAKCQASPGCIGAAFGDDETCLEHADPNAAHAILAENPQDAMSSLMRGVTIDSDLLGRVLGALASGGECAVVADFSASTFTSAVRFSGVTFMTGSSFRGATLCQAADFRNAVFEGRTDFQRADFQQGADFSGATFDSASFTSATFGGEDTPSSSTARFDGTLFRDYGGFDHVRFFSGAKFTGGCSFRGVGSFRGARFEQEADFDSADMVPRLGAPDRGYLAPLVTSFDDAVFKAVAVFAGVMFAAASFRRTLFLGETPFDSAQTLDAFHGRARSSLAFEAASLGKVSFQEARFASVRFDDCDFERDCELNQTVFDQAVFARCRFSQSLTAGRQTFTVSADFSNCEVAGPFRLDCDISGDLAVTETTLRDRIDWNLKCKALRLTGSRLLEGGFVNLRADECALRECDIPKPLVISGPSDGSRLPLVTSLQRSNVPGLTLSEVSLVSCLFGGAIGLDKLKLDGAHRLASPTNRWHAKRGVLAEEHAWRHGRRNSWNLPDGVGKASSSSPRPTELAEIYRSLRRGREGAGDEPGAADFYYGEMEMRRIQARPRWTIWSKTQRLRGNTKTPKRASTGESAILSLYWLLSGYGLRAWRAFAVLTTILAIAVVLIGFQGLSRTNTVIVGESSGLALIDQQRLLVVTSVTRGRDALIPRLSSATTAVLEASLLRTTSVGLSPFGRAVALLIKVAGPLLLGLGLLAVRGRAKR